MRRLLTSLGLVAILLAGGVSVATAEPVPESLSSEPIAGATFKGTVDALAYARGKFYVGGDYEQALSDGKLVTRTHLAAVSSDGELASFAPELNGRVSALAAGSSYLYVAGMFTEVDGHKARHVVRLSLSTGKVDPGFKVSINALPRALELSGSRLYVGGDFNSVNGQARAKAAVVDTGSGDLLPDFAPGFDRGVRALEIADGRLYVGGGFTTLDDAKARKFVAIDPDTGKLDTGFTPADKGLVYDITAYRGRLYAAVGGAGGRVMAYETDGSTVWERITDGDVTALAVHSGTVVAGGHFDRLCAGDSLGPNGDCLDGVYADRGKLFAVSTGNKVESWNPDANSVTGTHAVHFGDGMVAAGGSFTTFSGGEVNRRGLALFSS